MQTQSNMASCQEDTSIDHSLQTWDKWVGIRKNQTKQLAEKTGRPPVDLTMNLLEKVREEKERKTVLENAQLICKKPKVRGTPIEPPLRLPQRCYCEPVYEVQRTATELGKPPVIEHVAVPKVIQAKEKGLTGVPLRKSMKILNKEYEKYRQSREEELKDKIEKIDPYRPDITNLMVKGNKPKLPEKKLPPLPTINIIEPSMAPADDLSGVFALRINNSLIYQELGKQSLDCLKELKEKWNDHCTTWSYYFNVPAKRAGRSKLYLENVGTVTVRYCWKKLRKLIPYIPDEMYDKVFFFNKNEDVLYPGQSKEIFFTFLSEEPGIFSETWKLIPFHPFFDTFADKLLVNLAGDAVERTKIVMKKVDKMKKKINKKAVYNIVRKMIYDAVDKSTSVVPEIYPYKKLFLEAEMFVLKNPVCFYHQTEVGKMKAYYSEMLPGQEWDLSIGSWRKAMMAKEFDDRMIYFDVLKKCHSDLLKPWYEGESVLQQKYRAMTLLLGQLADKFDQEFDRLSELQKKGKDLLPSASATLSQTAHVSVSEKSLVDPLVSSQIRSVFYLHMYEHVASTMELCAGVLSSIDLNRWLEFDFGQW